MKTKTKEIARKGELGSRQRKVLELMGKGHNRKEIADLMGLSLRGIDWHVSRLYQCFEVPNRSIAVLILKAVAAGFFKENNEFDAFVKRTNAKRELSRWQLA